MEVGGVRLGLVAAVLALVLLALPAAAGAVLPGVNGKIAFVSGRDDPPAAFDNNSSQVWIFDQPGASLTRVSNNAAFQHRHPSWSPDYTKIVYAAGAGGDWDLWILDLTQPLSATNPKNITNTPGVADDRPSWSPDGTRIAWESRVGGIQDVYVKSVATGATTKLSAAAANQDAGKPAWSPDSQTIYYSLDKDATAGGVDNDILKEPAGNINGAGATGVVVNPGTSDFQPAVSADGQNLCFTRGPFTSGATVHRSDINGNNITQVAASGQGDYNCVWSPDGTKIAYTQGAGAANGQLVMKNSDGTGPVDLLANHVSMRFDGNPDWARNGAPTCAGKSITVNSTATVSIPLSCPDPPPESTTTIKSIQSQPAHGTLGAIQPGEPASVVYTPNATYSGPDSFTFRAGDGVQNSANATVNIVVRDTRASKISSVTNSHSKWRLGSLLPFFSRKKLKPVGTTISFRLDEAARVTVSFALKTTGRRVKGVCKALSRSNRNKPHCTRYVTKGAIAASRPAGKTKLRFQGKLSKRRKLGLGRYRVTIGAVDAFGNRSKPAVFYFTIVKQ